VHFEDQRVWVAHATAAGLPLRDDDLDTAAFALALYGIPAMPQLKRLAGRTALITGASRGIGRAVALAYAREGAHLVLVARTQGGLTELDDEVKALGASATLVQLDMTDGAKLDGLGPSLATRFPTLDIVIGNAAILGPLSPLGHIKDSDWENVMATNLTSNWRLIRTLDPLLRAAPAGRGIFVSSAAASKCRAYWGPYSVSKAALEALVKTYANEVASTPVRVNLLDPGATRTAMRATAMPGEDPATLPTPESLTELFIEMALPSYSENGAVVNARA
jgi:NAD(P)-dependent dehydrogenase (short-subunit alcohol dehydrogenase family)